MVPVVVTPQALAGEVQAVPYPAGLAGGVGGWSDDCAGIVETVLTAVVCSIITLVARVCRRSARCSVSCRAEVLHGDGAGLAGRVPWPSSQYNRPLSIKSRNRYRPVPASIRTRERRTEIGGATTTTTT